MPEPSDWWRGAVIYQIYPRSFQDSNDDGIGDLPGIIARLAYVKSLGVDAIWLSPFFTSPMRDFGYDVADYRGVDPMFGTMEDFDALLAAAHERGLKVIIDQVWSHSSSDHEWFGQSRQDKHNDKADWYVWADPRPDGAPPNNWQAWFGGAAWTWEPKRRQYYLHNFLPTQPDLNLRNPEVREAIKDVARFWLDKGVDGFRLDVVNYYIHDAELQNNPPSGNENPALPRDMQEHRYNSNQPETLALVEELRALTDTYGGRMVVGEIAPGSFDLMRDYTEGQNRLHTAYSFELLGEWPGVAGLAEIIAQWGEGEDDGWPSWALSNHDVVRVATRWSHSIGANPVRTSLLCLTMLMCLRGTIFLYQGEELGLPQADVPLEKLQDPWGVAGWPQTKGRDGCRTPMPWTADAHGDFSAGESWLPLDAPQKRLNAAAQASEIHSILHLTALFIQMRKAFPALATGRIRNFWKPEHPDLLVFARRSETQELICAFNFGHQPAGIQGVKGSDVIGIWGRSAISGDTVTVKPKCAFVGVRRGFEGVPADIEERPLDALSAAASLPTRMKTGLPPVRVYA